MRIFSLCNLGQFSIDTPRWEPSRPGGAGASTGATSGSMSALSKACLGSPRAGPAPTGIGTIPVFDRDFDDSASSSHVQTFCSWRWRLWLDCGSVIHLFVRLLMTLTRFLSSCLCAVEDPVLNLYCSSMPCTEVIPKYRGIRMRGQALCTTDGSSRCYPLLEWWRQGAFGKDAVCLSCAVAPHDVLVT